MFCKFSLMMAVPEQLPEIGIFRKKIKDLILMVDQIPQSDLSFHTTCVSECLPKMLETPIQLSLLPGRIQT